MEAAFWRQSVLAEHEEYGKLLYVQDLGELQAENLAADGTVPVMTLSFDLHASWLWLRHENSAVCPMHICWCGSYAFLTNRHFCYQSGNYPHKCGVNNFVKHVLMRSGSYV